MSEDSHSSSVSSLTPSVWFSRRDLNMLAESEGSHHLDIQEPGKGRNLLLLFESFLPPRDFQ